MGMELFKPIGQLGTQRRSRFIGNDNDDNSFAQRSGQLDNLTTGSLREPDNNDNKKTY